MYKTIAEKFDHLGVDNAPGQESQQKKVALDLRGEKLEGPAVDFSHGDVDAHTPTPGSFEVFAEGVKEGGAQAYTPYKGRPAILEMVASRISAFAGVSIDPKSELILTAGTQGALGTPAELWLNMQARYNLQTAKTKESVRLRFESIRNISPWATKQTTPVTMA